MGNTFHSGQIPDAGMEPFTFASLLEPLTIPAFLNDYQGKREWIQTGCADRFNWLLSWRSLNALIRDQRPTAPRFRLMKDGNPIPEGVYHRTVQTLRGPLRLLAPSRLLAELRRGSTLVWDAIDQSHPPIRVLKQTLERALRAFAFVNMYASWGTIGGVGDHWDDHDVFVLQITGHKNWKVHPPTLNWPLPTDFIGVPPIEYTYNWTLSAGSVLYLPRGWWHRVTPMNEPSLHLTIGILRPTNFDFLEWLLERSKQCDLVRQDFPFAADEVERVAHVAALRSVVEQWLQPSNIQLYERTLDETHYLDPRPTLQAVSNACPEVWDPDSEALLLSTRAQLLDRGKDLALVVAGMEWQLPKESEHMVRALIEGRPIRLGMLLEYLSSKLILDLVTEGVLAMA